MATLRFQLCLLDFHQILSLLSSCPDRLAAQRRGKEERERKIYESEKERDRRRKEERERQRRREEENETKSH